MSIFLNPDSSNDIVNITSTNTIIKIFVYDMLGKKTLHFIPNNLNYSFNIGASELYNVRVESEYGYKNFKIIIK